MTVTTTENLQRFDADGVTTEFFFTFKTLDENHIIIFLDDVIISAGFTVELNPDQDNTPGGTVIFGSPPANFSTVAVLREVDATQETDYTSYDAFPAESHESALDKLTMLIQQNNTDRINALRVPQSDDPDINKLIPGSADRALKFLFFDALGNADVREGTQVDIEAVKEIIIAADSLTMLTVDHSNPEFPILGVNNINLESGLMELTQQGDYPDFPNLPGGGIPIQVLTQTPFLLFAILVDDGTFQPGVDSGEMLTTYRQSNPDDPFGFVDIIGVNAPNQALHLVQLDENGQIPAELLRFQGLRNRGIFRGDNLCDKPGDDPGECIVPDTRNPSQRFPGLDYPPGTDPETLENAQWRAGDFFAVTMADGEQDGTMLLFTEVGQAAPTIVDVQANDGITFIPQIIDPDDGVTILAHHGWYHLPERFNLTTADLVSLDTSGYGFIVGLPNDDVQNAFNFLDAALGAFRADQVSFDTGGGTVIIQPGSNNVQLALLDLDAGTVNLINSQTIAGQKTFADQPLYSGGQGAAITALTRRDFVEAADAVVRGVADTALANAALAQAAADAAQASANAAQGAADAAQAAADAAQGTANSANANANSRKLESDFLRTGDRLDIFNVRTS